MKVETVCLSMALWLALGFSQTACAPSAEEFSLDLAPAQLGALAPGTQARLEAAMATTHSEPHNADALGRLGMLLHAYGFRPEAAACYSRARRLDPNDFRWHHFAAHLAQETGEEDVALELALNALALHPDSVAARVSLANLEMRRGELASARTHLEAALVTDPRSFDALYALGRLEMDDGRYDEAAKLLERSLGVNPDDSSAHYAAALAYTRLNESNRAAEHVERAREGAGRRPAIPLPPEIVSLREDAQQQLGAGTELLLAGELDRAVDELTRAVEGDPDSADAHNTLGAALEKLGRLEEAITHYQTAISIEPGLAAARKNLGALMGRIDRIDEAIVHLEAATDLEPSSAEAHHLLASALLVKGRLDDAIRHERVALELMPELADAYVTLGAALEAKGRKQEAVASYQAALARSPDMVRAHRQLGILLGDLDQVEGALEHLSAAVELGPDSSQSHHFLAVALHRTGRIETAIEHERKSIELEALGAQGSTEFLGTAHYNLGVMLLELSDYPDAIRNLEAALDLVPANAEILSELARAYHLQGNNERAIALQKRVVEVTPEDPEATYRAGVFCAAMGDFAQARQFFEASLTRSPRFVPAREALEKLDRGATRRP